MTEPLSPRLNTWALAAVAFLIVPVGVLAQKGEIILLGLAGAVLLVQAASAGTWRQAFRTPTAAIFIVLLIWSLATAAWAISTTDALELWKSLALIFAAILILLNAARGLSAQARIDVATWAAFGLCLGLALLAIEIAFDLPITQQLQSKGPAPRLSTLNAGISIALAVVWPVAAGLWRQGQPIVAIGLTVAVALVIGFSDATSAKIAYVAATGAFAIVWVTRRRSIEVMCLIVALAILAAPAAMRTVVPAPQTFDQQVRGAARSALHRLYIWDFVTERVIEKPFVGWGLDGSRSIPGSQRRVLGDAPVISLHPHNAALQIWLELGAAGAALAALLVMIIGAGLAHLPRLGRATSAATLFGTLAIASLSFGIWQNWWMAALGLIAVLSSALRPPRSDIPSSKSDD